MHDAQHLLRIRMGLFHPLRSLDQSNNPFSVFALPHWHRTVFTPLYCGKSYATSVDPRWQTVRNFTVLSSAAVCLHMPTPLGHKAVDIRVLGRFGPIRWRLQEEFTNYIWVLGELLFINLAVCCHIKMADGMHINGCSLFDCIGTTEQRSRT